MTYRCLDCKYLWDCDPVQIITELCDWEDELYDYGDNLNEDYDDRWLEMAEMRYTQNYWNMDDKEYK